MQVHYTRMWETVACAHAMNLSDHTGFVVQVLSIYYNTT